MIIKINSEKTNEFGFTVTQAIIFGYLFQFTTWEDGLIMDGGIWFSGCDERIVHDIGTILDRNLYKLDVDAFLEDLMGLGVIKLKRDPNDKDHRYLIQFTPLGKTWNHAFKEQNSII